MPTVKPRAIFDLPGTVKTATILALRPKRAATPSVGEWRSHFPVGVWFGTVAAWDVRNAGNTTAVTRRQYTVNSHLTEVLHHQEQGLKPNNLNYIAVHPGNLRSWEDTGATTAAYEADTTGGPIWMAFSAVGSTAGAGTGIENDWYARSAGTQTDADADAIAGPIVANLQDHPSILYYLLGDDIAVGVTHGGQEFVTIARAFQRADPYGRPAFGVVVDPDVYDLWTDPAEHLLTVFYRYPCGKDDSNVILPEGDFHRGTFENEPGMANKADWVDVIRRRTSRLPAHTRFHMILQTHQTGDGGLRHPTARELRKQFWIAVGEGATGLWWFLGDGYDDADAASNNNEGLLHIDQLPLLQVAAELSNRLTPAIRARLLDCKRVTDKFAASGGGSTGYSTNYANAYVSTLQDQNTGTSYCVVCNHGTSAASVTISSATLTGKLVNLETGVATYLPATVSLPALDGTIFRHDPLYGVEKIVLPSVDLDPEAFWDVSPWNPDGTNYIPPGQSALFPRQVSVPLGASLQTLVDQNPDETCFLLPPLYVPPAGEPKLRLIGRRGLQFISADPGAPIANQPILRFVEAYGSTRTINYSRQVGGVASFLAQCGAPSAYGDQALYEWMHPKDNFLFRNIQFRSDGTALWYHKYLWETTGTYLPDHFAEWHPIWLRNVRDVLIEQSEFFDYVAGHDVTQDSEGQPTATGGVTQFHAGMAVAGNGGNENVVVRNCATHGEKVRGWPVGFFLDGARGFVCASNNFTDGKWIQSSIASLTNDDWTDDWDKNGIVDAYAETRNARYCTIYDSDFIWGGTSVMNMTGQQYLVKENRLNLGALSNGITSVSRLCILYARASRKWDKGHRYFNEGSIFDGNIIKGGSVAALVELQPDDGYAFGGIDLVPLNLHGTVGRVTYKNNRVGGNLTSGSWVRNILSPAQTYLTGVPSIDGGGNVANTGE